MNTNNLVSLEVCHSLAEFWSTWGQFNRIMPASQWNTRRERFCGCQQSFSPYQFACWDNLLLEFWTRNRRRSCWRALRQPGILINAYPFATCSLFSNSTKNPYGLWPRWASFQNSDRCVLYMITWVRRQWFRVYVQGRLSMWALCANSC